MQMRFAVKQDEKALRQLFADQTPQSDLRNVENNYFGQEGLFVVLDDQGELKAAMGASRDATDSDPLHTRLILRRHKTLGLDKEAARAIMARMLDVCLIHAREMDFASLVVPDSLDADMS